MKAKKFIHSTAISLSLIFFLFSNLALAQTDISVLVVYTDDARAGAGSIAAVETQIIAAVDDGNFSLSNSNVDIQVSIADMRELVVNEGAYGSNLTALTTDLANPNHPIFDLVHDWRDETSADMVFLMFEGIAANGQAHEICGDGFPCDDNFAAEAFATGQRGVMLVAPVLFIHELGHVMGLRHDRTRDCGTETVTCINGAFPYSFGHIDPNTPPNWGTVMAGGRSFNLIDFFSNPNINHTTTGQALGIANVSDSSRSLNDVRNIIAGFRTPLNPVSNFLFNYPRVGMVNVDLLDEEPAYDVWYSHNFDRYGNGRSISWDKPNNAVTRFEYKIENGPGSRTGSNPDYDWTTSTILDSSKTSHWVHVLPGNFFNDFYSGDVRLPYNGYSTSSDDYILIYHRFRTEENGRVSKWQYLKPIALYQPD